MAYITRRKRVNKEKVNVFAQDARNIHILPVLALPESCNVIEYRVPL